MRRLVAAALVAVGLQSCEREAREFRSSTGEEVALKMPAQTQYRVGMPPDHPDRDADAALPEQEESHYEQNAMSLSEGKWLFVRFNCHGCHGSGGGGDMGPPLIDAEWRYGHRPGQVLQSILQGRPNGMPSFASKVTTKQAWELAAYVRSMSGLAPGGAAPGRDEHMRLSPPSTTIKNEPPRDVGPPEIPKLRPADAGGVAP
jgi:cytochrome c oxidase cbb3-type subunit 3